MIVLFVVFRKLVCWDKQDEAEIVTAFRDIIRAKTLASKEEILGRYRESLNSIYERDDSKKFRGRCYDKVWSLWKRYSKKNDN